MGEGTVLVLGGRHCWLPPWRSPSPFGFLTLWIGGTMGEVAKMSRNRKPPSRFSVQDIHIHMRSGAELILRDVDNELIDGFFDCWAIESETKAYLSTPPTRENVTMIPLAAIDYAELIERPRKVSDATYPDGTNVQSGDETETESDEAAETSTRHGE